MSEEQQQIQAARGPWNIDAEIAAAVVRVHASIDRFINRKLHFKARSDGAKRGWITRRSARMQRTADAYR